MGHGPRSELSRRSIKSRCEMTSFDLGKDERLSPLQARSSHWSQRVLLIVARVISDDLVNFNVGGITEAFHSKLKNMKVPD